MRVTGPPGPDLQRWKFVPAGNLRGIRAGDLRDGLGQRAARERLHALAETHIWLRGAGGGEAGGGARSAALGAGGGARGAAFGAGGGGALGAALEAVLGAAPGAGTSTCTSDSLRSSPGSPSSPGSSPEERAARRPALPPPGSQLGTVQPRPGGFVIAGPRESGKSRLARDLALHLNLNLLEFDGDLMPHRDLGESHAALRAVLRAARSAAPCLMHVRNAAVLVPRRGDRRLAHAFLRALEETRVPDGPATHVVPCLTVGSADDLDPAVFQPHLALSVVTLDPVWGDARERVALVRQLWEEWPHGLNCGPVPPHLVAAASSATSPASIVELVRSALALARATVDREDRRVAGRRGEVAPVQSSLPPHPPYPL